MLTKPKDVPYCGVDADKIDIVYGYPEMNVNNFRLFVHYIKERYRTYRRKELDGSDPPWTNDEILNRYKFTNVRREHDRQSRELIRLVSTNDKLTLIDKIYNTFMFRAWNNADTFTFFRLPAKHKYLIVSKAKETARRWLYSYNATCPGNRRKWWSSAYNQGGTKAAWKFPVGDGYQRAYSESEGRKHEDYEKDIVLRVFHIPLMLHQDHIVERIIASKDQKECFEIIKSVRGFSDFLAYQIFVDLTYIPEFQFSENEFTVAGPGCKKGIDLVFKDRKGFTYEECIFWLRDNMEYACDCAEVSYHPESLFNDLEPYDRELNVMSLENCFCEFSKYMRTHLGQGRPRVSYTPHH